VGSALALALAFTTINRGSLSGEEVILTVSSC